MRLRRGISGPAGARQRCACPSTPWSKSNWVGATKVALAISPLAGVTGCRYAQSIWNSHGPAAQSIGTLSMAMTVLFLVITAIMWALFLFAFYRRRGTLDEHEPIDAGGGEGWIAVGGIAIPLIVLTALFVAGLDLMGQFPIHGSPGLPTERQMSAMSMKPEILIIGHQWWWEIHYLNEDPSKAFITADELHLPAGRRVNIEVKTADVMHSLWIPALNGKVDMIPGQANYIRIIASRPGIYQGQCAEYCGIQHAHMRLLAVVQERAQYQAWLAAQRLPGARPTTPEAIEGEHIFVTSQCATCHTVRGSGANGEFAPDLTHIGSRRMLAADIFPNNDAYLEAWITNAQSLKLGAQMPSLPDFTGEQLSDLVAYLRQLK
jgi:cytochrome c oxidase subunit II